MKTIDPIDLQTFLLPGLTPPHKQDFAPALAQLQDTAMAMTSHVCSGGPMDAAPGLQHCRLVPSCTWATDPKALGPALQTLLTPTHWTLQQPFFCGLCRITQCSPPTTRDNLQNPPLAIGHCTVMWSHPLALSPSKDPKDHGHRNLKSERAT